MLDFVHGKFVKGKKVAYLAESKRLKLPKSTRRRFSYHYQYGWRKQENIRRWIILIKIIYSTIFICFTISTCLNQSIDENIKCSKSILIRIWDIWYTFLSLILLLSLLIDRLKRQNTIPLKSIHAIQLLLAISFLIFVILGHVQAYHHLWWSSSNQLIHSTLLSVVLIDLCPISISLFITINSLKKRRLCRRVQASTLITSV